MRRSPRDGSGRKKTPKKPIESYEHKDKQRGKARDTNSEAPTVSHERIDYTARSTPGCL